MSVPLWAWFAVVGAILAMLLIDLLAHRRAHVISVREAAGWSAFWVALGVGFALAARRWGRIWLQPFRLRQLAPLNPLR